MRNPLNSHFPKGVGSRFSTFTTSPCVKLIKQPFPWISIWFFATLSYTKFIKWLFSRGELFRRSSFATSICVKSIKLAFPKGASFWFGFFTTHIAVKVSNWLFPSMGQLSFCDFAALPCVKFINALYLRENSSKYQLSLLLHIKKWTSPISSPWTCFRIALFPLLWGVKCIKPQFGRFSIRNFAPSPCVKVIKFILFRGRAVSIMKILLLSLM